MNRTQYMTTLAQKLRRLPKEDYDKAMAYFEEYFEEAGLENESQAILDLGTPECAANALIMDLAVRNTSTTPKTVKKGFSAVWVGILGVCAAPIALPLAFSFLMIILSFFIVIFALVFSLFITALSIIAAGVVGIIGGVIMFFIQFPSGLATLGLGLTFLAVGIAGMHGSIQVCRVLLKKTTQALGKITKGGKKHETNQ